MTKMMTGVQYPPSFVEKNNKIPLASGILLYLCFYYFHVIICSVQKSLLI